MTICLLGGTGFVGHRVAYRLAADGHRIKILTRRRERHRDLLVLPSLSLVEGNVHDLGFLRAEFQGVDAVINLVGILNSSRRPGQGFEAAHYELPARIMESIRQNRVPRYIHMSALHADEKAPSEYLRTKGRADTLIHSEPIRGNCRVTSFRPSVIFGPGDGLTSRFAALLRQLPIFPLACPDARMQPVFVGDVAHCFVAALSDPSTYGRRYDLCGPKVYTLEGIVTYIGEVIGVKRRIVRLSNWQSKMQARVMEWLPGKLFTRDNYLSLQVDSVCDGGFPSPAGLEPAAMEEIVPTYLASRHDHLDALRAAAGR